jgi:hypothetical protein
MKNSTPPPAHPHFEWGRVTDNGWPLFPNHSRNPVAHVTPAAGGMWRLLIGAGRAGPFATRQRAFLLGLEHARARLGRRRA